jgi:hypothetical protein
LVAVYLTHNGNAKRLARKSLDLLGYSNELDLPGLGINAGVGAAKHKRDILQDEAGGGGGGGWACATCSLLNAFEVAACEVCAAPRQRVRPHQFYLNIYQHEDNRYD